MMANRLLITHHTTGPALKVVQSGEFNHLRPLVLNKRPTGYISEIHNLAPTCGKCNQSKGNKPWHTWITSSAKQSPKSRGVSDLNQRIETLQKYEAWLEPTKVDFESVVGTEKWEQALIRRMAVQRVFEGESPTKVIRGYGMNDRTIHPWIRKAKAERLESLGPLPRKGRPRNLTEEQEREVARWIVTGDPRQYGYDFGLWTRQTIADLIKHRLGISLSINSVGRFLYRQGITPQKPLRRAYERDEEAVQAWVDNEYPKIQKSAKKQGAEIYWLDEEGIRSDDPLGRTWRLKK
jgi:transposase